MRTSFRQHPGLSRTNISTAGTLSLAGTATGGWSGTTKMDEGATLALAASNQALKDTSAISLNGSTITLTQSSGGSNDLVSNSAAITANSGTLSLTAGTAGPFTETIGPVNLASGQLNFVNTTNASSGRTTTLSDLNHSNSTAVVTFSGATLATSNKLNVTSAGTTTTGQIIGPWATTGTEAASQLDYAVFGSDTVVPANIKINNTESTWASASNITLSASSTTLTGTRSLNSLRAAVNTGEKLALGDFNLETTGSSPTPPRRRSDPLSPRSRSRQ